MWAVCATWGVGPVLKVSRWFLSEWSVGLGVNAPFGLVTEYEIPGAVFPIGTQIGSGTRLNGTTKVYSAGTLEITERQLDLAIDGEGFFGVLLPDGVRVTRSLRQSNRRYEVQIDTAFEAVIQRCADPTRDDDEIATDDEVLLKLALDWLCAILFNEPTLQLQEHVLSKAIAKARGELGGT